MRLSIRAPLKCMCTRVTLLSGSWSGLELWRWTPYKALTRTQTRKLEVSLWPLHPPKLLPLGHLHKFPYCLSSSCFYNKKTSKLFSELRHFSRCAMLFLDCTSVSLSLFKTIPRISYFLSSENEFGLRKRWTAEVYLLTLLWGYVEP